MKMNDFINEQMTEADLDAMPYTKQLLIKYVNWKYEENADISNESLMREWWSLKEENRLAELFCNEWVYSESRWNKLNTK